MGLKKNNHHLQINIKNVNGTFACGKKSHRHNFTGLSINGNKDIVFITARVGDAIVANPDKTLPNFIRNRLLKFSQYTILLWLLL